MIDGMLDLFAGTGVGVAANNLGITEYGVENNKDAVATRDTAGFLTPYQDAWDVHLPAELGLRFNTLWASPPCQTFSAAGKGKGRKALDEVMQAIHDERFLDVESLRGLGDEVGDERTALVLLPLTYIHEYKPHYVALEQVPTVLPVWEEYAEALREWGYSVWTGYLHSEQYGVPQTRKRAYLIARRDGVQAVPPTPTHSRYYPHSPEKLDAGVKKWVSMRDALGRQEGGLVSNYSDHSGRGFPVPGSKTDRGFRPVDEPAFTQTSKTSRWGLTNQPSPTNTSHLGVTRSPSGIGSKFAPNTVNIDTNEGGVLQGYPHGFPFQGSKTSKHLQIGNAVPPPVAEAVLRTFMGGQQ